MGKYFAGVQFVIEAESEKDANDIQREVSTAIAAMNHIVDSHADEPVEFDEFGHAG